MLNMGLESGFRLFSVLLQDVELAVTLLYQLGEGAAEETLKPGSGALGQLATGKRLQYQTSQRHVTASKA